jgi:putative tryptophan/tyrosine transport system substrate-binding protein
MWYISLPCLLVEGCYTRRREFLGFLAGSLASLPLTAAGAKRVATVGILWHAGNEQEEAPFLGELRQGLRDQGYAEGRDITLINTFADEQYDRFTKNARDLVEQKVDVIVAVTRPAALAAQKATRSIPIVGVVIPDPVGSGLVTSLARPGGNVTALGNWAVDLAAKRVELLKEAVAGLTKVILFVNPGDPSLARIFVEESKAAADRLGLPTQTLEMTTVEELEAAFAAIAQSGTPGIIVNNDAMLLTHSERIARLANARGIPTLGFLGIMAKQGILLSYGPDSLAIFRRSATYVDKILKGARPADLPVEQPTTYQLFINMNTAKSIGIAIPATLLSRADEVIE